jgi:hypothetical protein
MLAGNLVKRADDRHAFKARALGIADATFSGVPRFLLNR